MDPSHTTPKRSESPGEAGVRPSSGRRDGGPSGAVGVPRAVGGAGLVGAVGFVVGLGVMGGLVFAVLPGAGGELVEPGGLPAVALPSAVFPEGSRQTGPDVTSIRDVKRDADGDRVADGVGDTVSVRGVVTAPLIVVPGEFRAYVQDATGGIRLRSEARQTLAGLALGDTVTAVGVVGFNAGTDYLEVLNLHAESQGPAPEPREVSVGELLDESLEGILVVAEGRLVNAQNVELRGGGASVRVRARQALLADEAFQERYFSQDPATVVGILEQFDPSPPYDAGYRIELREASDLQTSPDFRPLVMFLAVAVLVGFFWFRSRSEAARARRIEGLLKRVKASEEAVREREMRLRTVTEATTDVIWDLDLETGFLEWGDGGEDLFGVPPGALPDKRAAYLDWILEEDRKHVEAETEEALASGGDGWEGEYRIVRPDGRAVVIHDRARILRNEHGVPYRMIGALVDVTEHRAEEEARRALRERMEQAQRLEGLGVLAGGIAHDFNNLLTGILGNAEMLEQQWPDGAPDRSMVEDIHRSAQRAAMLTQQMLAYAGRGVTERRSVDLNAMVREMHALLRSALSKKTRVVQDLAPDLPQVSADPAQLQQVVMNLLTNASEALEEAPGTVTVRTDYRLPDPEELAAMVTASDPPDTPQVVLSVSDTGMGMDHETRQRIFDPFFTTKFDGRGLGLSAVLGIIQQHGGHLSLRSSPQEGTTFTVFLPPEVPGELHSTAEEHSIAGRAPAELRALVVDDETAVRDLVLRVLRGMGIDATGAAHGAEGVARFRERPHDFDLVFLDLTMPEMGGEEALGHLRAVRSDIPVVFMSGYAAMDVAQRLGEVRHATFLEKPFRVADVRAAVSKVLKGRAEG